MKLAWAMGIVWAVLVHAAVILFGGWFFLRDEKDRATTQEIELLSESDAPEEKKEGPKPEPTEQQQMEADTEEAPNADEIIHELELSSLAAAPALDDASLGAIDAALNGLVGAGGFGDVTSFVSGGRIGGTGDPTALGGKLDDIMDLSEIDQKPRAVFQAAPLFPSEMRGKKVEGVVTLIFVVDPAGRVSNPRVEKSSHPAFERPALDAIKQWKFEPAVKGGARVSCKMRQSIRFRPS